MKKHPRLVALGVDAYKLSNTLNQLIYNTGSGVSGMTGMLFLESNRQVSRELMWGKIRNGKLSKI
jgi:outer membrane PBP1 activator LpoA protein